jgi:hypothetical protein
VISSPKKKEESHVRPPKPHPHLDQSQDRAILDRYGTPEMARGSVKHPHFPPMSYNQGWLHQSKAIQNTCHEPRSCPWQVMSW